MVATVTNVVQHTDWTGLGTFIGGCATFLGVIFTFIQSRSNRKTANDTKTIATQTRDSVVGEMAPQLDEVHSEVVNGKSQLKK